MDDTFLVDSKGHYLMDINVQPLCEGYGILEISSFDIITTFSVVRYFSTLEKLRSVLGNYTGWEAYARFDDRPTFEDVAFDPEKDVELASVTWMIVVVPIPKGCIGLDSTYEILPKNKDRLWYKFRS